MASKRSKKKPVAKNTRRPPRRATARLRNTPGFSAKPKQGKEVLRESELRFRTLGECIGDVFWISDPTSRKLVYVTQAFADIWGRNTNDLYDHFETWRDAIHEDDRPRVVKDFFEQILAGTYDAEYRVVRPDGSIRWIHDRCKPLGIGTLVAGVAEDITERKQVEESLRKAQDLLQETEKIGRVGGWEFDIDTGKQTWTDEVYRIHDVSRDFEPTVDNGIEFYAPDSKPIIARVVQRAIEVGEPFDVELEFLTAKGNRRWVHAVGKRDVEGRRVHGFFQDITERKRVEEGLRESEERFRTMADAVPSFLFETDADGWNIWTSPGWCRFTGQTPEQVAGHGWAEALHHDDRAANIDRWVQCMKDGVPFESKQRLRRVDGSYAWVIARALPVRDSQGKVTRWVGSVTDVDAIVQAEEELRQLNETLEQRVAERTVALRKAEEHFRGIFEHAAEGIAITDLEGHFALCNAAYTSIVGYTEQELSSLQFESLIHPDDRLHNMKLVRQLVSGDVPAFEVENRYLTKSGRIAWVHKHASILRNDDGVPTHLMVLVTDISARKQSELLLQEKEAFIRDVLDSLSAHVCVLDQDGIILQTNEPWKRFAQANSDTTSTIGVVGENYLGVCRRAIATGDTTAGPILAGIEAVLAGRERFFSVEYPCHLSDEQRWFLLRVSPLMESQGAVVSHLDITDRKRVEESLLLQQQELELSQAQLEALTAKLLTAQETERQRIARDLHDDITQRMAAVAIDLQNVRLEEVELPLSLSQCLSDLGTRAEQLTTDVQRMAHQLHPSLLEHAGLEPAVREHVEEFAGRTGLKIDIMVRDLPEKIPLDQATCLYRVLQESLQNVRKHANATAVLICLLKTARGVGLCVHDDGSGFEQNWERGSRKGLGLTSMAERVKALQGGFRVRTKPGDGTEVHVWVPIESPTTSDEGEAGAGP